MKEFPSFLKRLDPTIYLSQNYLVLDFETTNHDKGSALDPRNSIICAVAGNSKSGYRRYLADSLSDLVASLNDADFIVCHHAKFELQWLYRLGVEPGSVLCYDTLLGAYVQNGNLKRPLDLDSVARRFGLGQKESYVATLIKGGVCPSEVPLRRLLDYCEQDVRLTEDVFLRQRDQLRENFLLPCLYTRCLTSLVLADMEAKGMWLDRDLVRREYNEKVRECSKVLADLHELTGGINPKSPKQVAEFLYDNLKFDELTDYTGVPIRTPAGGRKTDEATIIALRAKNEHQRSFCSVFGRYIPLKKELETLTKLFECAEADAPLFASFNQAVTVTHRLSSSGKKYKVQFQNIDSAFKRLFKARHEGWKIGSADGRQLEFRTAVHLGNDEQGKLDIAQNADIHRFTASVIFKKEEKDVTKTERTAAKPFTFRPLYGGSSGTPEVRRYNKAFQAKYKGVFDTQKGWTYEVLKAKKLRTETGLVFYWPDVELYASGYIKGTTEIFNYPVQSLATAEIIPISLIYLWYRLKVLGAKTILCNTVHDSIVSEVPPEETGIWAECVKEAFTSDTTGYLKAVYGINFRVPLGVSYNIASHWDQGKEIEYDSKI